MKFNIAHPVNGTQVCIEVDDDKKCQPFFDRRMGAEVEADTLGDEWKGYILKITGGNDKQGFPMKQGVLVKGRIKVFMDKGHSCYRPRRNGERKRKTVRGCIVGPDLRTLSCTVAKIGDKDVAGLTDTVKPRRLGPKRASKLKKLFGISKEDKMETAQQTALLRQNVIRRTFNANGKDRQKAPKIQRLVTADRIRNKKIAKETKKANWKNSQAKFEEYNKFLVEFKKAQARKHSIEAAKRKASQESKEAEKKEKKAPAATTKKSKK